MTPKVFELLFQRKYVWIQIEILRYEQGEWTQTVKSNLDLTERKHAINFNLKVDSDQGRLGI